MYLLLVMVILFLGFIAAMILLSGLAPFVRMGWPEVGMLLPSLIMGIVTADVFLLGGVAAGRIWPSPMMIFLLFGGLLMVPIILGMLILDIWVIARIWKKTRGSARMRG